MVVSESQVLIGLSLLSAKHFLVDFVFQSGYQLRNKGKYGHPGGLLHSILHAVFSAPALWVFTKDVNLIAIICGIEFLVHYHMDWAKDQIVHHFRWTISDQAYWHAFGFDQFVHALTYIAIAAYFVMTPALR